MADKCLLSRPDVVILSLKPTDQQLDAPIARFIGSTVAWVRSLSVKTDGRESYEMSLRNVVLPSIA